MQLHNTSKIPTIPLELLGHALSRMSNEKHRVPVHTMECQYKHQGDSTSACPGLHAATRVQSTLRCMHVPIQEYGDANNQNCVQL